MIQNEGENEMKRSIKKTVALAVAATSLLTLAACGSKNEEQGAADCQDL